MSLPSDPHHAALQAEATAFIKEAGFYVGTLTYHDAWQDQPDLIDRLGQINGATAVYVRTQADCIAMHSTLPVTFLWDVKTNSGPYRNASFEAIPLVNYSRLEVRCLYIYRDAIDGFEGGFWAHKPPPISRVVLPDRWQGKIRKWMERRLQKHWPDIPIESGTTNGSGDPFVLVQKADRHKMINWQEAVLAAAISV